MEVASDTFVNIWVSFKIPLGPNIPFIINGIDKYCCIEDVSVIIVVEPNKDCSASATFPYVSSSRITINKLALIPFNKTAKSNKKLKLSKNPPFPQNTTNLLYVGNNARIIPLIAPQLIPIGQ